MLDSWTQKNNKLLANVRLYIKEMRTEHLVAIPGILGFLIIAGLMVFYKGPFSGKPFELAISCVIFSLLGVCGLIIMLRRELPSPIFPLRGIPAMIVGTFELIVLWGFALFQLVQFLKLL